MKLQTGDCRLQKWRPALAGLVAALIVVTSHAQSPAFEVASVKPDKSGAMNRMINMPADRFEATNVPLQTLVAMAYGDVGPPPQALANDRISGGPSWMGSDLFDIVAKAGGDTPPGPTGAPQKLAMLRSLLAERFKLVVHHETRTAPIYVVVLARSDGKLGPQLQHSDVDCQALAAARGAGPPPPPPVPGDRPLCGAMVGLGPVAMLRAGAQTMPALANMLSRMTGRIVIDRTGLTGAFDVDVRFNGEDLAGLPSPPAGTDRPAPAADTVSLFTALQEQLGLKLDAQRGPIDVVVVDHAEQPTEDHYGKTIVKRSGFVLFLRSIYLSRTPGLPSHPGVHGVGIQSADRPSGNDDESL